MPKWPALGAFKRPKTYSVGSITFGLLIVAFINLLREILQIASQVNADNGGNICVIIMLCMTKCFVGILDLLVAYMYFNHHANTYIALYGKACIPAARYTLQIIKVRGINESLARLLLALLPLY